MEPKRRLYLVRSAGEIAAPIEVGETVADVGCCVIEARGFGIRRGELLENTGSALLSSEP